MDAFPEILFSGNDRLCHAFIQSVNSIYVLFLGGLFMAYVISDDCISCGACAAECPVEAISEGAEHFEINADVCIECGACAGVCPVEAPKAP